MFPHSRRRRLGFRAEQATIGLSCRISGSLSFRHLNAPRGSDSRFFEAGSVPRPLTPAIAGGSVARSETAQSGRLALIARAPRPSGPPVSFRPTFALAETRGPARASLSDSEWPLSRRNSPYRLRVPRYRGFDAFGRRPVKGIQRSPQIVLKALSSRASIAGLSGPSVGASL